MKNRHDSIVKYCSEDDIILDVNPYDELIGSYVFQLVNTFYQAKKETWALYLNHITYDFSEPIIKKKTKGFLPSEIYDSNTYRTA